MFDGTDGATGEIELADSLRTWLVRTVAAQKRERNREVYDRLADE